MALQADPASYKVAYMKPFPYFYQKVDLRSRSEMVGFLIDHDRYPTMNSWNHGRSFSNCVKVHHLDLPEDVQSVMFDALQIEYMYEDIRQPLEEFCEDYHHNYHICHNGRSGGYLVLYKGTSVDSGWRSQCRRCRRLSKNEVDPKRAPFNMCPYCNQPTMSRLKEPILYHQSTGKGYGEGWYEEEMMDPGSWDIDSLRDEVRFIQAFDRACSNYVEAFVWWCREMFNQPAEASA